MHISELVAVGVFCSYFSIIAGLFLLIARSLFSQDLGSRPYVFIALAITSFVHTWFYMFKFMAATNGFSIPSLFEQAWANVCFGQVNWWWSQQLCLFTVGAWTIFLSIEGRRHNVQFIWAYMLLGQLVAISVASNLFYLALVLAPRPPSPSSNHRLSSLQAPVALWLPVLLSLGTVATSPFTSERSFLPNLLLMHSLIVLPLLAPDPSTQTKSYFGISLKTLYILVFGAALALHTRATGQALGDPAVSVTDFAFKAWDVLHSHPAQSSIGWDVIWTSISFVVWLVLQPELQGRLLTATYLLLATPLVSVGVLAPHVLRPRENEREEKVQ
ncbi:hypothetical protein C8F04DRAFT_1212828 [Mycena alexandri]|uniref:Uncharacterized protein n=1 Tax=Mycena alexandri TaxID=1745969 RepID=A0AAD6WSL2_9AGAR|nr:hypothetical protein C8F04DRAFT_1212828 [Mycena alexandri]